MLKERYFWLMIALLVLTSLACNAFAGGSEPVIVPSNPATVTAGNESTAVAVNTPTTLTPAANVTSTAVATGTPTGPTATMLVDLNVRSGPAVQYDRVSFLLKDESATIVGAAPTGDWWQIECPPRTPLTGIQCWISAGTNFSTAVNTAGVPIAEVPPTPTPVPPEPQSGRAIVGFVDNGRLLVTHFDPNGDEPAVAEAAQILPDDVNVQAVFIAPDGRRAAYLRGGADRNELHVVNLDGGDHRLLVESNGLPVQTNDANFTAIIDQVRWLPDSSGLAFNTAQFAATFGGSSSQEDLWTASLDGVVTQRLPFFQGGGDFLVLPNGQIILSKRDAIEKVNADGSNRIRLVTFDFINTASEYIYYPILQLARDGNTVYTAVPSSEPFTPEAFTRLWRIAGSNVEEIGRLPQTILFNPVRWTDSGARLGYAAFPGENPPGVIVADGSGDKAELYETAEQATFFGWSGDGQHFLYSTPGAFAVGTAGDDPVGIAIPAGGVVQTAEWLTNSRFIFVTRFESGWRLDLGSSNGTVRELLVVNGDGDVAYDVWGP